MKVNKEWMETNYNNYNHMYFNDILPQIGIGRMTIQLLPVIKQTQYLGQASWKPTEGYTGKKDLINKRFIIKINNYYDDLFEIEWQNVLLHEMIHIWQYITGYKGGHGKSFLNKAKEINEKYGWEITSTYKEKYIKETYYGRKLEGMDRSEQ